MPDFKLLPTVNGTAVSLASHSHGSDGAAANAALWLDASDITGLADTDPVTTWLDSSGNGRNATQATAGFKPTYRTNVLGGRPVVRFDGTDDRLVTASLASTALASTSAIDVFIVMKQTAATARSTPLSWTGPDSSNTINAHLTYDDTMYFDHGDIGSGGRISGSQPGGWDDAFHVVELYRSGATGRIVVDGTTAVSGTFSDSLDAASATLSIGSTALASAFLGGDIAELIIYPRALTAGEQALTSNYLNDKYNLRGPASFAAAAKWMTD